MNAQHLRVQPRLSTMIFHFKGATAAFFGFWLSKVKRSKDCRHKPLYSILKAISGANKLAKRTKLKKPVTLAVNYQNLPTKERLAQAGPDAEIIIGKKNNPTVIRQSTFERLIRRKSITGEQALAGERFRNRWAIAGLESSVRGIDLNRIGGAGDGVGMPRTEVEADARREIRTARQVLGEMTYHVVTKIVCEDFDVSLVGKTALKWQNAGQAHSAALERLRMGLDILAEEWGYKRRGL